MFGTAKMIRAELIMIDEMKEQQPSQPCPYRIHKDYDADARIVLHKGRVERLLPTIPSSSITLVVTSPPYNLGKEYETRLAIDDYLRQQAGTIRELHRVLADDGSICWQVGNYVKSGEVYPLDIFYYKIFKDLDMFLRNRIIWRYGHGQHASNRFSGRYETILWFTKSHEYIFNLDSVRLPAKYPGKVYNKGPKKGKLSGNPRGKNPSDFWDVVENDWSDGVWTIPNVKASHPEKTLHPCQFPIELVERCVLALTNEDDWVLDPYAGVGSSLIAAIKHRRRAVGCEKEEDYVQIATRRVKEYFQGTLKMRPLGKPLREPRNTEKVAQVPEAWKTDESSIYYASEDE